MDFLENIPQPLFKYRIWNDEYQKRLLTHNEVYLASADQFNDPFDASIPYRFKDEELTPENIYLKLLETGRRESPDLSEEILQQQCYKRQYSGVFESGQYWKEQYDDFKKNLNENFGILSLTSKNNNLLMWSHYAVSHTGFCVGIDKFALFKTIEGQLGPVIYSNQFPKIGIFDKSEEGLNRILTTKSVEWQYEEEFRISKIYSAKKVYNLPNEAILEIILGNKMTEENKQEIIGIANQKFPSAKLFQSQINLEEFKLEMIPIIRI